MQMSGRNRNDHLHVRRAHEGRECRWVDEIESTPIRLKLNRLRRVGKKKKNVPALCLATESTGRGPP